MSEVSLPDRVTTMNYTPHRLPLPVNIIVQHIKVHQSSQEPTVNGDKNS